MDITIQNEEKKQLMKRKDYKIRVFSKGATPSRDKVLAALAKKLDAKPELLVVRQIAPEFGVQGSIVSASVYADKKSLDLFEAEYMRKRHEKKAAEKPAEKPAEAPAEKPADEKPAEEKPAEKAEEPEKKEEEKPAEKTEEKAPEEKKEGDK